MAKKKKGTTYVSSSALKYKFVKKALTVSIFEDSPSISRTLRKEDNYALNSEHGKIDGKVELIEVNKKPKAWVELFVKKSVPNYGETLSCVEVKDGIMIDEKELLDVHEK